MNKIHWKTIVVVEVVLKLYLKLGKNNKMRHLYAGQVNNKTSKTQ